MVSVIMSHILFTFSPLATLKVTNGQFDDPRNGVTERQGIPHQSKGKILKGRKWPQGTAGNTMAPDIV